MALDELRHQSTRLGLLDEITQESDARLSPSERADSLLHGGKASVKNAGTWQLLDICEKTGPRPARASSLSLTNTSNAMTTRGKSIRLEMVRCSAYASVAEPLLSGA